MSLLGALVPRPRPLPVGLPAPVVSLTATDGSWVRSTDHRDRYALVFVFFRDPDAARDALVALEAARPQIEGQEALLFGINQSRPDRLRAVHEELGLGYPLLYDLLAMTARAYRNAGLRPYVRDGFAIVDRDGRIAVHRPGTLDPEVILAELARLADPEQSAPEEAAGSELPTRRDAEIADVDWARVEGLLGSKEAPFVLLDVRTPDEYDALHHPAARNIPLDELPNRVVELPNRARVLCVCQTGGRATAAVGFLVSSGFTEVYNIKGGIAAWPGRAT